MALKLREVGRGYIVYIYVYSIVVMLILTLRQMKIGIGRIDIMFDRGLRVKNAAMAGLQK